MERQRVPATVGCDCLCVAAEDTFRKSSVLAEPGEILAEYRDSPEKSAERNCGNFWFPASASQECRLSAPEVGDRDRCNLLQR